MEVLYVFLWYRLGNKDVCEVYEMYYFGDR